MVAKKRPSKRQTLQQKYKIVKRTKQHHKKLKKGDINGNRKSKIEDKRIPNAWPYKEQLLKDLQVMRDKTEDAKLRAKEKRQEEINKKRLEIAKEITKKAAMNSDISISSNVLMGEENEEKVQALGQNSRRAYLSELRKVVENADVILHILDARDPLGTKSKTIEDMVLSDHRKKLVYVLNKADLVPRDILIKWLSYLRKLHPTISFKCNTQDQKDNLSRSNVSKVTKHIDSTQTSRAVGAEELLGLLKNYCRSGDTKTIISVGIVGFPNVGKSSLINSLMRCRAVGVSSMPGFTKQMQTIVLDKNIRLLDSPGVVFADGCSASTVLRNCVNIESMEDVITPIQAILERCPQPYLMQLYSIPKFTPQDVTAFLALVARATGKLKKGGVPNIEAAAKTILHDWSEGRIKYYCRPPIAEKTSDSETKILTEFSPELNLEDMNGIDRKVVMELEQQTSDMDTDFVDIEPIEEILAQDSLNMSSSDTTEEASGAAFPRVKQTKRVKSVGKAHARRISAPSEGATGAGEDYDFEKDFTY